MSFVSHRRLFGALGRERVKYSTAGKAHRHAAATAAKAAQALTLSRFDLRVMMAVTALTVSYSRLADRLSVSQVAAFVFQVEIDAVTRRQRHRVGESLRRLHKTGVIEYEPGRGPGAIATIGLPEPPEESTPPGGVRSDEERHPDPGTKAPPHRGQRHPTRRTHTEKYSEKYSEEREALAQENQSSSSVEPTPVEVLDPEDNELLRDEAEPDDLTSRFIFALRSNKSRLSDEELAGECDAAVRRALAKFPADVVAKLIAQLRDGGAQYPSALDAKIRSVPRSAPAILRVADGVTRRFTGACATCGGRGWLDPQPDENGLIARDAPVRPCPECAA